MDEKPAITTKKKGMIFVSIKTPDMIIFEGHVYAFSSINENGIFDIIESHANFICMVYEKITLHLNEGFIREINLDQGVLKAHNDIVRVFLGIETLKNK